MEPIKVSLLESTSITDTLEKHFPFAPSVAEMTKLCHAMLRQIKSKLFFFFLFFPPASTTGAELVIRGNIIYSPHASICTSPHLLEVSRSC